MAVDWAVRIFGEANRKRRGAFSCVVAAARFTRSATIDGRTDGPNVTRTIQRLSLALISYVLPNWLPRAGSLISRSDRRLGSLRGAADQRPDGRSVRSSALVNG